MLSRKLLTRFHNEICKPDMLRHAGQPDDMRHCTAVCDWLIGGHAGEEGLESQGAAGAKLQAHALVGWAASCNLRLDAYSLGPASALLGAQGLSR